VRDTTRQAATPVSVLSPLCPKPAVPSVESPVAKENKATFHVHVHEVALYPPSPPYCAPVKSILTSSSFDSVLDLELLSDDSEDEQDEKAFVTSAGTAPVTANVLDTVFPAHVIPAASVRSVDSIQAAAQVYSSPTIGTTTLYIGGLTDEAVCDREVLVGLLELADEEECDAVVVALAKRSKDLAQMIHSLLYVGGSVINPAKSTILPRELGAFDAEHYVLVGLDV